MLTRSMSRDRSQQLSPEIWDLVAVELADPECALAFCCFAGTCKALRQATIKSIKKWAQHLLQLRAEFPCGLESKDFVNRPWYSPTLTPMVQPNTNLEREWQDPRSDETWTTLCPFQQWGRLYGYTNRVVDKIAAEIKAGLEDGEVVAYFRHLVEDNYFGNTSPQALRDADVYFDTAAGIRKLYRAVGAAIGAFIIDQCFYCGGTADHDVKCLLEKTWHHWAGNCYMDTVVRESLFEIVEDKLVGGQ